MQKGPTTAQRAPVVRVLPLDDLVASTAAPPSILVQATLGHASVATTGRYLHARPNDGSARYLAV